MKRKIKQTIERLIFTILSISALCMFCTSVYAEELGSRETVIIDGYECYMVDGQYYTEIDGKECVFFKSDLVTDEETITALNNGLFGTHSSASTIYTIDLTDGHAYHGYVNATYSDVQTTYFKVDLKSYFLTFAMLQSLSSLRIINITCYFFVPYAPGNESGIYDDSFGKWYHAETKLRLIPYTPLVYFAGDSAYRGAEVVYLVIHSEGTNPKEFNYQLGLVPIN